MSAAFLALRRSRTALWFKAGLKYYVVGYGIYEKQFSSNSWVNLNQNGSITRYALSGIRGTGLNDIYAAGDYGEVIHFNGSSWKSFHDQTSLNNSVFSYFHLSVKGNIVAAVGLDQNSRAVIVVGHHL